MNRMIQCLVVILLISFSCKEDANNPTEPPIENSVEQTISASSGGTLTLKDNIKLIIPPNTLQSNGSVYLGITGKEPKSVQNEALQVVGQPLTIKFPSESIQKTVQLQFPKPSEVGTGENYIVVIYNGTTYLPLESSIVGTSVNVNIDVIDWETNYTYLTDDKPVYGSERLENKPNVLSHAEPARKPQKLTKPTGLGELIIMTLIILQTPSASENGLREISTSGSVHQFVNPTVSSNSKIIVFIHGWTSRPTVWESFINTVKANSSLGYTDIWTFGYNSSLSVESNGQKLYEQLRLYANGKKVDIVCHSMGGLVARAMIEKSNGSGFVNKLVTIATPHAGSPLAAIRGYIGNLIAQDQSSEKEKSNFQLYNYFTQGLSDLQPESKLINDLKTLSKPVVPYYCIAAINQNPTYFTSAEGILPGADDGVVTENSALAVNQKTDSKSITIPNLPKQASHNLVTKSEDIFNQVKAFLQADVPTLPTVSTEPISDVKTTTATCGGTVISDGGATITARGICWSTSRNPTTPKTSDGLGTGRFTSSLTGLSPNTTYYVQAYASTSSGTSYGNEVNFKTNSDGSIVYGMLEYNGFKYKTVTIGTQEWTVENLRTTKYNDGTQITKITDNKAWSESSGGAYCAYSNNEANVATYGYLYNWTAVNTKKLAPAEGGWRIPTEADWDKLLTAVGGSPNAGTKLKAKTGWSTNTGTDDYGFNALPGGIRSYTGGGFSLMGDRGYWWSSDVSSTSGNAWRRLMFYNQYSVDKGADFQKDGDSVRLVRDK